MRTCEYPIDLGGTARCPENVVKLSGLGFHIGLLRRLIKGARYNRIALCLENLSERPIDMELLFDHLPFLNMTLDVGHAQLFSEENRCPEYLKRYPERIRHIHLHDNQGGGSPAADLHLPIGMGIVPFK